MIYGFKFIVVCVVKVLDLLFDLKSCLSFTDARKSFCENAASMEKKFLIGVNVIRQ